MDLFSREISCSMTLVNLALTIHSTYLAVEKLQIAKLCKFQLTVLLYLCSKHTNE